MKLSNVLTENRAIKAVINFETRKGRKPKDVRRENVGYDIESSGRLIEVKGVGKKFSQVGSWRSIQQRTLQFILNYNNFYIYVVDNLKKGVRNAGIYVFSRGDLLHFVKIKPVFSYTFSISAKVNIEKYKKK